jgi:predicted adenylyl cyclase CyaB
MLGNQKSMPRNIEIKAHIDSVESHIHIVAAIANEGPIEILQDDTFFTCANGRMKLRAFSEKDGVLIFYQRANQQGPKESFYVCSPTASPETLREALTHAYGQAGRVQKHRTLFIAGRTRVHLDRVKNLGHFLELEIVLREGESPEAGVQEAHNLMAQLGVEPSQLIEDAYVDLLSQRGSNPCVVTDFHGLSPSPAPHFKR